MPEDSPRRGPAGRSEEPATTGLSRHLAPFVEDPALRPVLFVLIAHLALAGAIVLLAVARTRSPFAGLALALLLGLSIDVVVRARRRRRAGFFAALLWALAVATALAGDRLGLL